MVRVSVRTPGWRRTDTLFKYHRLVMGKRRFLKKKTAGRWSWRECHCSFFFHYFSCSPGGNLYVALSCDQMTSSPCTWNPSQKSLSYHWWELILTRFNMVPIENYEPTEFVGKHARPRGLGYEPGGCTWEPHVNLLSI